MSSKAPHSAPAAPAASPVSSELACIVRQIARACEVDRPLLPGDARWLDLSSARGDRATQKLLRRFEDKPIGEPLHILFASHRGAGKTTELTRADIEYAVQRKKQRLRDLINANGWWSTLAAVARDKQIVSDAACLTVLYHRLVLKYNGDGWYDVLPLITELPEFQHASQQLPPKP